MAERAELALEDVRRKLKVESLMKGIIFKVFEELERVQENHGWRRDVVND